MTRTITSVVLLAVLTSACSDSNDGNRLEPEPSFLPITNPTLSDPPDEGTFSLTANTFDLADVGYEAQEYFVSGTASSFTNVSELTVDGMWEVEAAEQADYTTRIVVHRPIDATDFSGTVAVEWLNVTSGFDIPPSWGAGHVELYRSGLDAIRAMDTWMRSGEAPPSAPRLNLNDDQSDYQKDDLGNSTGGIRTPYVDAPSALFSGVGNTGDSFCRLFGSTFLLSATDMASAYIDAAGFTEAVAETADAAVAAGYLLPEDAEKIIAWAPSQWAQQAGN